MLAAAFVSMLFACGAIGTAAAEIKGIVIGPNGRPLADATVVAVPIGHPVALRLELADDPAAWEQRSAERQFRLAIPANVAVRLSIPQVVAVVVPAQDPGAEVEARIAPQHRKRGIADR